MRFSLRKVLQVTSLFTCMLLVNLFYGLLIHETQEANRGPLQRGDRQDGGDSMLQLGQPVPVDMGAAQGPISIRKLREKRSLYNNDVEQSRLYKKESASEKLRKAREYLASNSRPTELHDIFISVKTTKKFHQDRLKLLLETWVLLARDVVSIYDVLNVSIK